MTPPILLQASTIAPLRLALFSGKGGVGKTTLSCGFARCLAQAFPEERILLLSTDPAHSLGDVLQVPVTADATPLPLETNPTRSNLSVQALDARSLLHQFKARYGDTLELLLERGSFVEAADLGPVWDLNWPGLDELMGILEIQRLLREGEADRVVVDMAPSGHSLNLFALMDFLDRFLEALELFQDKHRAMQQAFGRGLTADQADEFLQNTKNDLQAGRSLLQDQIRTACLVVSIPEPMSLVESQRFVTALGELGIPWGGVLLNRVVIASKDQTATAVERDRLQEQYSLVGQFQEWVTAQNKPLWMIPLQDKEPVGLSALDQVFGQMQFASDVLLEKPAIGGTLLQVPPSPPFLPDFLAQGRKLLILGGKGGVGKTTVSAAIGWGFAQRYPQAQIRVISIDPAHSLGDAFDCVLGHEATQYQPNLSLQEIDAEIVLDQFREDYLWELAEIMSGDRAGDEEASQGMQLLYGPQAWRTLADQSLPGIDEMLSLITIMDLLDREEQSLIVLDTAPTGHLLRFLEMPTALGDWLGWIFKLWIKYQNVVGRADFMGRLRGLRKQVVEAQKKLTDPQHTEFIAVCQNQSAILAETQRLIQELENRGISHHFVVENRADPEAAAKTAMLSQYFAEQTVIHLPNLPRSIEPVARIAQASEHLLGF